MSTELTVRSAQAKDTRAWLVLWHGYCAGLDGAVSEEVTEGVSTPERKCIGGPE